MSCLDGQGALRVGQGKMGEKVPCPHQELVARRYQPWLCQHRCHGAEVTQEKAQPGRDGVMKSQGDLRHGGAHTWR